ncbi:MAG: hypothetical protein IPN95_21240 [Bacteroidetes bacterium]|nr:hypothetical protein [Bacteroidota bacterium]
MEPPKLKYWPPDYAPMIKAAFRYPLFHDSFRSVFHAIPEWLTALRLIFSRLNNDHIDDLRMLMLMFHGLPPFDGACERSKEIQSLQAELWGSENLFPWFAGILKAKEHIGEIVSTLRLTDRRELIRSCMTAIVLMDDAAAAEACWEVYGWKKSKFGKEWDSEFAMGFWLMDQRMGTSYLAKANLDSSLRGGKIKNAVVLGDIVRGGIPVENRSIFQRELAELIALSTPFEGYPPNSGQFLPRKLMHHWDEIARWRAVAEGDYLQQKAKVSELYHSAGLKAATRFLGPSKSKKVKITLPFTQAVQQFAGRGWDPHSVGQLLATLQPHHSPRDLETALELDIHLRLPIRVVEAIFENLIAQFPLYFELYQRFAVQLLLRSKTCDARAAALYAKGDALRAQWKMQWFAGFQIPMKALTVPEANNHPDAALPYQIP